MKKLFFTALIATVAVGGALSVNAQYLQGQGTVIPCFITEDPSCASRIVPGGLPEETPVYPNPAPGNQGVSTTDLADYTYLD